MQKAITLLAAGILLLPSAVLAQSTNKAPRAATNTSSPFGHTGQPDVECEDFGEDAQPGHSATAPGSAFNEDGVAPQHYAGQQSGINDKNEHSVSQYDVACARSH
jgi:hypothetical protein